MGHVQSVRARLPRRRGVRARLGVLEDVPWAAGDGRGSEDPAATLDDLREVVTTLEDAGRIARRVYGGAHPLTSAIEVNLQGARAKLRARETPSPPGSA